MVKITHGKVFRTRAGKLGCYEYRNGKKSKFVTKARKSSRKSYTKRRY